ncbi:MAG: alginate export family protein [Candidatus Glassbacteria bacterium]
MLKRLGTVTVLLILACHSPAITGSLDEWTDYFDGRLKIGGQIRFRAESRSNYDFNNQADSPLEDDGFSLSRVRLNFDVNPIEQLRLFIELQDSHQFGTDIATSRRVGPGAFEDRIDIFQAYLDLHNMGKIPLTIRLGRQTLAFGAERLVGSFGWSNVGRSFQGISLILEEEPVVVQAWWTNVIVPEDKVLNEPDWADDFFGVHASWKNIPSAKLDTYFLFRDNSDTGRRIYALGGLLHGTLLESEAIDYNAELTYQTGDFSSDLDHSALAFHAGAGYTLKLLVLNPRFGFQYNLATGDENPSDTENRTFDNLYPTNHGHYGYIDFLSWRNMRNLKLESSLKPCDKLTIKGDLHLAWLEDVEDAWYNAGGGVIRGQDASRKADTFLGHEIDITARCSCIEGLDILAGYSRFFTGGFVEDTGDSDDPEWFFLQTAITF